MNARKMTKEEWAPMALLAHNDLFGVELAQFANSCDFSILVEDDQEKLGYATVTESDKDSAYLYFGGAFSNARGQNKSYGIFKEIVNFLKPHYKRIGFATKTKNKAMIKLGLNENFEIIGLNKYKQIPYVEFLLEV